MPFVDTGDSSLASWTGQSFSQGGAIGKMVVEVVGANIVVDGGRREVVLMFFGKDNLYGRYIYYSYKRKMTTEWQSTRKSESRATLKKRPLNLRIQTALPTSMNQCNDYIPIDSKHTPRAVLSYIHEADVHRMSGCIHRIAPCDLKQNLLVLHQPLVSES
jgi:hypothetical protein